MFNFTETGLFTLVDRDGEPVYPQILPIFDKLISHCLWILLWGGYILLHHYLFPTLLREGVDKFLMSVIFVHLFFLGCRLTTLLLKGGLKAIFFPHLWMRITRRLCKNPSLELLRKYHLETHPGLLANLALAHISREEFSAARSALELAMKQAPENPIFPELLKRLP